MKREDIKKAAQDYDDSLIYSSVSEQCDVKKAFEAGVKWSINRVWHPNTEMPNRNLDECCCGEKCLIQTFDGGIDFGIVLYRCGYNGEMSYTIACMDKAYNMNEIKLWAYTNDFITIEE